MHRFIVSTLIFTLAALTGCDDGGSGGAGGAGGGPGTDGGPPDQGPVEVNLGLQLDPAARACEVMLTGTVDVVFDGTVEGRHLRRGDQLALAFTVKDDAAFAAGAVALAAPDADAIEIASGACFDAAGAPIADAEIVLVGR